MARHMPVIGVNNTYRLHPVGLLYACDFPWWARHLTDTTGVPERWTCDADAAQRFGLTFVQGRAGHGLSEDSRAILHGNNSGHQAISLAVLLGATRVWLLGFDCGYGDNKEVHFHGRHGPGLSNPDKQTFARWREAFDQIGRDCAVRGIEVINLSRQTALRSFPRISVEDALTRLAVS